MAFIGLYQVPRILKDNPEFYNSGDWMIVPFPKMAEAKESDPRSCYLSQYYYVNAQSSPAAQKAAWEFLAFCQSKPEEYLGRGGSVIQPRKSVLESSVLETLPYSDVVLQGLAESKASYCEGGAKEIEALFRLLYIEVDRNLPKNDEITQAVLRALVEIILYQLPREKQPPSKEKERLLIDCKDYIDCHFTEELTVEKLAERSHMSVSGFAHQFKKIFGFPPIQYIIRRRIGQAQTLLITTDLSITEVSVRVGYDNISYFNNQFKRFAGMSPQSYRKYKVGERQFKNLNKLVPHLNS